MLYIKYPRPLTKKEKAILQEEAEKDELEAHFQKMYGLEEEEDEE